jgi:hypothetical protein
MKNTFLILAAMLAAPLCNAQWLADTRLTNAAENSFINNSSQATASSGDQVHVVWYDFRDGELPEVYYKRSTDGGLQWEADVRFTNDPGSSVNPAIGVSGNTVHVVWSDDQLGNDEIFYRRSFDGGATWGDAIPLTSHPAISRVPSIAVNGSILHIIWRDEREGNSEIYYKRSTDGGTTWSTDTRLTNDPGLSNSTSISVSGTIVHAAWRDVRNGLAGIYYKRSSDSGDTWGTDELLSNATAGQFFTSISSSLLVVHTVWSDSHTGNAEIYYKRSTDGGISWEADVPLTDDPAVSNVPTITASSSMLHVLWSDARTGARKIYYKQSADDGSTWNTDAQISDNASIPERGYATVSGSTLHVLFNDGRDGNQEIYYKRNPTGNTFSSVGDNDDITTITLSPNPTSGMINVHTPSESATRRVLVTDILGQKIIELDQATGSDFILDLSMVNPGTYFVKIIDAGVITTRMIVRH